MKDFIEKALHQKIYIREFEETKRLPLMFSGYYKLNLLEVFNHNCIVAEPINDIGLTSVRKHYKKLRELTGNEVVLYFKELSAYARERLLDDGIPFIWEGHQIYMPFIGIWLKENDARDIEKCNQISFLTQKLLLLATYECWKNYTVTKAAEKLNVSKMSVTRAFDEIESMEIPILVKEGRKRLVTVSNQRKDTWERIKAYLRYPLLNEYYLKEDIGEDHVKGGISALCEYSLLSDNEYPTYALTKNQIAEKKIKKMGKVPKGEQPGCVVQEVGYIICFENDKIDPLTVFMLMEKEMDDPRVEKAVEEMLEEYLW